MKSRLTAILAAALLAALPAFAAEATFERNLAVTGRADLSIATGSGKIHLSPGPAGQIHIVGRVYSSWGSDDATVRNIAAHPPIDQTGNIVRVGARRSRMFNIAIDYEVQAPPDTYLDASTGSGPIEDEGVGMNPRLNTGSGSIRATGLHGNVTLATGSGRIQAELASSGNVKAETGSGSIELRNVQGSLRAQTGSGSVNVGGTPTGPWEVQTGSGSVDFWPGSGPFNLEAACGSGRVQADRQLTDVDQGKHSLNGKANGGGPLVRISTGSGSIRIH